MSSLILPKNYKAILNLKDTEVAIKIVKDNFERLLSESLNLSRVTAPLFVLQGIGINDDLSGVERPVSFAIKDMNGAKAEVVHSLAKWKRMILKDYNIRVGDGIYTDMNAIRADESLSNIHSLYVDQWDWEKVITKEERTLDYLKYQVEKIYEVLKVTERVLESEFKSLSRILPQNITFIDSEELLGRYPSLNPKEREREMVREEKAIFITRIGKTLSDGKVHDLRSPDYDDWELNGDLLLYNPLLDDALEISSMGIRVDEESLEKQLKLSHQEERKELLFHRKLLSGKLPLSIGGGIGQSRLCMFFLKKAHIGEIQASIWPDETREKCRENNIFLV